jgi:hypothetical protein
MKIVRALSICTFLLSFAWAARALDPDRDIHQLAHRSWGAREGYPGRSQALAQTRDGFLWIGSDVGLFRFDGVHFERYVPESGGKLAESVVQGLLALPDGSLWITYSLEKRICVLQNGHVKNYGKAEGVRTNSSRPRSSRRNLSWSVGAWRSACGHAGKPPTGVQFETHEYKPKTTEPAQPMVN